MFGRVAITAALLAASVNVAAQDAVRLDPRESMQCAVWASIFSEAVSDAEMKTALLYGLSYFVGQYEGATGRSIKEGHDEAAVTEVVQNPDSFSIICQEHMGRFGPRMVEWGVVLNELGERLSADGEAQLGN